MPIETLVHHNQALYYKALQDSHAKDLDCRPFIDFMLDAIGNSLYKYIDVAAETASDAGANVPVNVLVNSTEQAVLDIIKHNPSVTYDDIAIKIGKTRKTVSRAITSLKQKGIIFRSGSDKSGHWAIP